MEKLVGGILVEIPPNTTIWWDSHQVLVEPFSTVSHVPGLISTRVRPKKKCIVHWTIIDNHIAKWYVVVVS